MLVSILQESQFVKWILFIKEWKYRYEFELTLQNIFWVPPSLLKAVSNNCETGFLKYRIWIAPVSTPNTNTDGLVGLCGEMAQNINTIITQYSNFFLMLWIISIMIQTSAKWKSKYEIKFQLFNVLLHKRERGQLMSPHL